jgi:hypothetical protein
MKKTSRICFMSIASILVFCFVSINLPAQNTSLRSAASSCSDSKDDCKQIVEFVSRRGSCLTFRCEAGTKKEHLIKTSSESDIRALFNKIEEQKRNPRVRNDLR